MSSSTSTHLDDLARDVRDGLVPLGVLTDEEVVLLDAEPAEHVDAPRLAAWSTTEQDVARAAVIALLRARGELAVADTGTVELRGVHAAVAALREQVTARLLLVDLSSEDGWHVVVDAIDDRDLAMARLVDHATGIHVVVTATRAEAVAWALQRLDVDPEGDARRHPAEPGVVRADDPDDLDPLPADLEADADVVLAVLATARPETETGAMTVTSGRRGIHLHRGFATTTGEEHTRTHLGPRHLAAMLATLLQPPDAADARRSP